MEQSRKKENLKPYNRQLEQKKLQIGTLSEDSRGRREQAREFAIFFRENKGEEDENEKREARNQTRVVGGGSRKKSFEEKKNLYNLGKVNNGSVKHTTNPTGSELEECHHMRFGFNLHPAIPDKNSSDKREIQRRFLSKRKKP